MILGNSRRVQSDCGVRVCRGESAMAHAPDALCMGEGAKNGAFIPIFRALKNAQSLDEFSPHFWLIER